MGPKGASFVLVVGHGPSLEADDGAASMLRQLGAEVRTLDLWEDFARAMIHGELVRAIVFEAGERPDLAVASLRAARRESRLADVPALIQLPTRQVARLEPSSGFDDFIVTPYDPAELYARIRALEWKKSEFSTEERLKIGALVVDRAAHEVTLDGGRVSLTAKEFALLAYLAANRGRVFSRDVLLARVWGARYEGVRAPSTFTCVASARSSGKRCHSIRSAARGTSCALRRTRLTTKSRPPPLQRDAERSDDGAYRDQPRVPVRDRSGSERARRDRRGEGEDHARAPRRFVERGRAGREDARNRLRALREARACRGRVGAREGAHRGVERGRRRSSGQMGTSARGRRRGPARVGRCRVRSRVERRGRRDGDRAREQRGRRVVRQQRSEALSRSHRAHPATPRRARSGDGFLERAVHHVAGHHAHAAREGAACRHGERGRDVHVLARALAPRLRASKSARPRLAVCSLNPHAGEGGLLGGEEKRAIAPGIARAVTRLARPRAITIEGPVGAETAFRKANARGYDGVVAMYHDQATIPTKLVGFGESVNVSLGLPIVRTSVDHGTGYDIAGKGLADARGMSEAIALAVWLSAAGASSRR